jgi:ParB-like chromosome segregation protein Spo0J
MSIVNTPLDEIERHPENPNLGDVDALEESIIVNGFYSPILVQSSTGYILAGNHRWEVAKRLGAETIPAIFIDVDEHEARRIMVADNRITRLGEDDPSTLVTLLASLLETEEGTAGTGYTLNEYQSILDKLEEPLHFAPEPEDEKDLGDLASAYSLTPVEDERSVRLEIIRRDGLAISPADMNDILKRLGGHTLTPRQIESFAIESWA